MSRSNVLFQLSTSDPNAIFNVIYECRGVQLLSNFMFRMDIKQHIEKDAEEECNQRDLKLHSNKQECLL